MLKIKKIVFKKNLNFLIIFKIITSGGCKPYKLQIKIDDENIKN